MRTPESSVPALTPPLVEAAARPLSLLRIALWIAYAIAGALALAFAVEAAAALLVAAQRAAFPYADLQYSEGPLVLQLQRVAAGQPAYLSTLAVNSYVFGPVYLYALAAWNALAQASVDVPSDRFLTMGLGLCGIVPLVFSAMFIARRATSRASARSASQTAAAIAATLGLAVLPRTMTFDAVHPDDLLFTLVATMLACYNAAAGTTRNARFVWALAVAGALACFTEASAAVLAPALLLGLAVIRAISIRALIAGLTGYVLTLLAGSVAIGNDARAWALLVPLAQPWDISAARVGEAASLVTQWHPYIGVLLAATALVLACIWRRHGLRTVATDALPLLAIVGTAAAGYFLRGGLKNALFVIGVLCVPYFAALIATLATPRVLALRDRATVALAGAGLVLAAGAVWALQVPLKQAPDAIVSSTVDGAKSTAAALCSHRQGILVMALPDLFAACPKAAYALGASFQQLADAFPAYYMGQTVFDQKLTSAYVVTIAAVPLPRAWAPDYILDRAVPTFVGYDEHFFPDTLQVYRHR